MTRTDPDSSPLNGTQLMGLETIELTAYNEHTQHGVRVCCWKLMMYAMPYS